MKYKLGTVIKSNQTGAHWKITNEETQDIICVKEAGTCVKEAGTWKLGDKSNSIMSHGYFEIISTPNELDIKVGTRLRQVKHGNCQENFGKILIIQSIIEDNQFYGGFEGSYTGTWTRNYLEENFEKIREEEEIENIKTNKKTIMSYLKTVSIKLRAALGDEKANQIIAGLRNDDLSLTEAGKNVVVNAIADGEDAKVNLVNEANRIIEIEEAKKKD